MNTALTASKNAKPLFLAPRDTPAQGKGGGRIEEQFGRPVTLGRTDRLQYAILAGGCFWCLEGVYELLPGVEDVVSGYEGGPAASPTYEEVSTGATGYAESVLILFDPAQVSYSELLDIFWHIHDPTTKDRQGYDIGPQYRSAIFYLNETQKAEANAQSRRRENCGLPPLSPRFGLRSLLARRGLSPGLLQQKPRLWLLPGDHHSKGRKSVPGQIKRPPKHP